MRLKECATFITPELSPVAAATLSLEIIELDTLYDDCVPSGAAPIPPEFEAENGAMVFTVEPDTDVFFTRRRGTDQVGIFTLAQAATETRAALDTVQGNVAAHI